MLSALVACVGFFVYLVLFSDFIYIQYDAYYYAAIADNFLSNGTIRDGSSVPPLPVKTPQNAIVIAHIILDLLGVESLTERLVLIAFLNSLSLVASCYVLFRIAMVFDIDRQAAFLVSLTLSLSFYYHMVLLQAINDALFLLLSLFAIYLIVRGRCSRRCMVMLALIAAVIPFFRVAGILVFFSAFVTHLLLRQYRHSMLFLALVALGAITPFVTSGVLGVDYSGFGERKDQIVGLYGIQFFADHLWRTVSISVPEAFVRLTYFTTGIAIRPAAVGFLISITVMGFVVVAVLRSWRNKDAKLLYLCIFVAAVLTFFQLHTAQPTRYILVLSPLLPLFLLLAFRGKEQLLAARGFFALCVLVTIAGIAVSEKPGEAWLKKQYSADMKAFLENKDYLLLSYFPRVTYFLLEKPTQQLEYLDPLATPGNILVVGPPDYVNHAIGQIARAGPIEVKSAELLPGQFFDYRKNTDAAAYFQYDRIPIRSAWLTIDTGSGK
ncbi:MAG: hypothetical protein JSW10_12620 [Pseudomonadota bacterium]|nr:MAG: hypothetical protein JSW10_12620 [Pseudomonadota bacterium]